MKHIAKTLICTAILVAASASGCARHNPTPSDTSAVAVSTPYCAVTPKLKYKHAGSLSNWTEESYYNAPVVTDLDDDGNLEIVFSNYSITVLDASSGSTKWRVNSGHDRTEDFAEFGKSVGTPGVTQKSSTSTATGARRSSLFTETVLSRCSTKTATSSPAGRRIRVPGHRHEASRPQT